MRPGKPSELKRTWLGPGVMQMAQGAPGAMVPVVALGLLPMAGRALGSTGTSIVIVRRNFSSLLKTLVRRVAPDGVVKLVLGGGGGPWVAVGAAGWCLRL